MQPTWVLFLGESPLAIHFLLSGRQSADLAFRGNWAAVRDSLWLAAWLKFLAPFSLLAAVQYTSVDSRRLLFAPGAPVGRASGGRVIHQLPSRRTGYDCLIAYYAVRKDLAH